jgi:hypothetical protein
MYTTIGALAVNRAIWALSPLGVGTLVTAWF